MARISLDSIEVYSNDFPPDFNRGITNLVDTLNSNFSNIIADRTADIGAGGAGPTSVAVKGMTASSIVLANIQSSTNAVGIQKVTATSSGFDILFDGDPGASCFVNFIAFITSWAPQGD